jgi:hypothetical protein
MRIHEIITELTFNGLPCTKDCSGNSAGFSYSRLHNYTDPDKCRSRNGHPSFLNACRKNAADQRDGKYKIKPPVRGNQGRFQKFQPEKPDRKKFHQKPEVQEPRNDSHTMGY